MTDRAAPDRAAAPAPLVDGVSLINVLIREHERAAAGLDKDGDEYAQAHRDTAASLAAVLAALDGREAGWLPIESAPRDGTEILTVGTDSWNVIATKWLDPGPYVRTPHTNYYKPAGFYWASWSEPVGPANPTLWRPLPAPPARPQPAGEAGDE